MGSEWTVEEVRAEAGYLGRFADVHAYEAGKMLRAYANLLEQQASAKPVAAATVVRAENGACYIEWAAGADMLDYVGVKLYTRPPAQPAGVSDDARESLNAPPASGDWGKVREVIGDLREWGETDPQLAARANYLTAALPENAK